MQPNLTKSKQFHISLLIALALTLCKASPSLAVCGQQVHLPSDLQVTDQFRAPLCQWCSGNRGIEYRTIIGSTVVSVADGVASFVGVVAGTNYVVIKTSSNILVTHGRMASVLVKSGAWVTSGQPLGVAGESLYIGVRVSGQYVDPRQCAGLGSAFKPRALLVAG